MDEACEDHIGRIAVAAVDRERHRDELRDVFEAPSGRRVSWVRSDSGRAGRQGRERVQSCAASRSVVIYFCASRTSAMRTRRELMSTRGMPQSQQRRRLIDTLTVRSGSRKFPAKVPDAISIPVSSVLLSSAGSRTGSRCDRTLRLFYHRRRLMLPAVELF